MIDDLKVKVGPQYYRYAVNAIDEVVNVLDAHKAKTVLVVHGTISWKKAKKFFINYLLAVIVMISIITFGASGFALIVALFIRSYSERVFLANTSMAIVMLSAMFLAMSVALLHTRLNTPDIDDDNEFEQKYISMFSDDTKARQEFVELYRKKESA